MVWGEGCCCCRSWSSANRCGVKVDVWLWSGPINVKGREEIVAKRGSSMRRLIERKFQSQSLDSGIVFYLNSLSLFNQCHREDVIE